MQSVGKIPVSVKTLGADMVALSAHKFGGPKGIGALWIRRGVRLQPQQTGGRHERSRRAGTENVPAIAGMGVAARDTLPSRSATRIASGRFGIGWNAKSSPAFPARRSTAIPDRRVPNTTNISFDGIEAESLLIALDLEGVAVSTGSACSSGTLEPSHVLRAMNLPSPRARNSLRFSLGRGDDRGRDRFRRGRPAESGASASSNRPVGRRRPLTMRVVVAMSGGVDSSVAASLLVEAGHDVVGLSMQLYDQRSGEETFGSCCSLNDLYDARRVAASLGIPALHRQFRRAISRDGGPQLRGRVRGRPHADSVRALQRRPQVRDARRARRRPRRRCGGHRSLRSRRVRR